MKNNKKQWIWFRRILILLFIIFLINYFSVQTGYYQNKIYERTVLTEEGKREFENDIQNGLELDVRDYITDEYVDTTNGFDKVGRKLGEEVDDFINHKVVKIMNFFSKFFQ